MKKFFAVVMSIGILLSASAVLADEEETLMQQWRGPKVDAMVGAKQVFRPNGTLSYRGSIVIYPLRLQDGNDIYSLGVGYKFNGWKGANQSIGERHLAKLALDWENENQRLTLSALAGKQSERGRNWKNQKDLVGGGFYYRWQDNEKLWFFKAETWGQFLAASGGGENLAFIDIGGRLFIYNGKVLKPYVEANFSLGTKGKFASLSLGIGVTDKNEIFYAQVGPYFDLRKGGVFGFADIGIDLNNLAMAMYRASAEDEVTETPPAQIPVKQQENDTPEE